MDINKAYLYPKEATILQTRFEQGYLTEFSMNDLDYTTQGIDK